MPFGFSVNLLTLAMVLAIGLVVDDAIVWWKRAQAYEEAMPVRAVIGAWSRGADDMTITLAVARPSA